MFSTEAQAEIRGVPRFPNLRGTARFVAAQGGTVVQICVHGLPAGGCGSLIGLFLQDACGGFPPRGALPPLTNAGGMALATFLTDDFMPGDILGMNLVLTETTMPGACQGAVIAAGRIVPDPFGQPSCPGDPPPRPGCGCDRLPAPPCRPAPCPPMRPPLYPRPFPCR